MVARSSDRKPKCTSPKSQRPPNYFIAPLQPLSVWVHKSNLIKFYLDPEPWHLKRTNKKNYFITLTYHGLEWETRRWGCCGGCLTQGLACSHGIFQGCCGGLMAVPLTLLFGMQTLQTHTGNSVEVLLVCVPSSLCCSFLWEGCMWSQKTTDVCI